MSTVGVHVFLGKGGVGKTTCSAATALHLAEAASRPWPCPPTRRPLCRTFSRFLRDEVRLSLVTIPEALSVLQLDGVMEELDRHGLAVERLRAVGRLLQDPGHRPR